MTQSVRLFWGLIVVLLVSIFVVISTSNAQAQDGTCAAFDGEVALMSWEMDSSFLGLDNDNTITFPHGTAGNHFESLVNGDPMFVAAHNAQAQQQDLGGTTSVGGSLGLDAYTEVGDLPFPQFGIAQALVGYKVPIEVIGDGATLHFDNYVLVKALGNGGQAMAGLTINSPDFDQPLTFSAIDVPPGQIPPPPSVWGQELEVDLEPGSYTVSIFVLTRLTGVSTTFDAPSQAFIYGEWAVDCAGGLAEPTLPVPSSRNLRPSSVR